MKVTLIDRIKSNFGAQVFAAFTVLVFIVSVSFMFVLARFQYRTMISELENTGKLMAEILAYQSRLGLYSENERMLKMPVEALMKNDQVLEACLLNQDAGVVIRRERGDAAMTNPGNPDGGFFKADVVEQFRGGPGIRIIHEKGILVVWAPVRLASPIPPDVGLNGAVPAKGDPIIGYVRLTLGKAPLEQQLWRILRNTVAMGLAFWAAAALITYLLAKQIHLPIKRLTRSVKQFGAVGVCEDLPVETPNEIGTLARAFQEMTKSLDAYIQREIETAKELARSKSLAEMGMAASKVTHEVGNLLNNLGMVLPPLKTEPLSPKGAKRLEILEKEADRLKTFITDFLQFAKRPGLRIRKVRLELIIREVLSACQSTADQCNIVLSLDWPADIAAINADPQAMHVVFNNLVKNGIEAVEKDGWVKVTGYVQAQELLIIVEDNGPGVDANVMGNLFDPFYSTKGHQGTGLGLSIVRSIVQAHHGLIGCESTVGEGTRFVVRLPLTAERSE